MIMWYKVIIIAAGVAAVAAFGVGRSFHSKAAQALAGAQAAEQKAAQALSREKDEAELLAALISAKGDLTERTVQQKAEEVKLQELALNAARSELDALSAEHSRLTREVSELESRVRELESAVKAPESMAGMRLRFIYTGTRFRDGESLDGETCTWNAWQNRELTDGATWIGHAAPAELVFSQANKAVVKPTAPGGGFMLVCTYQAGGARTAIVRRELAFSPGEPGEESGEYILTFETSTGGTAALKNCFGGDNCFECENIRFTIEEAGEVADAAAGGLSEADIQELDEICGDILTFSNRWSATSKLYVKRIITLAPLVEDGADIDVTLPETKGNTLLHYACAISNTPLVIWLVNHGADVNKRTDKGMTPLDCVSGYNAAAIRAILIQHGAVK